jgi:hypothetical protein
MTAASHTPILQYAVNTYVHRFPPFPFTLPSLIIPLRFSGFWEIYLTVREFIHSCLRKELSRSPAKVFFVGHSMAGALASFAAVDFSLHSLPRITRYLKHRQRSCPLSSPSSLPSSPPVLCRMDAADQFSHVDEALLPPLPQPPPRGGRHVRVGLYTYGSPRVGNWSFSHFLNRVVPNSFRVGRTLLLPHCLSTLLPSSLSSGGWRHCHRHSQRELQACRDRDPGGLQWRGDDHHRPELCGESVTEIQQDFSRSSFHAVLPPGARGGEGGHRIQSPER